MSETSRPWRVSEAITDDFGLEVCDILQVNGDESAEAFIATLNGGEHNNVANAQLIVTAVNDWERLRDEIKQCAMELDEAAKIIRPTLPRVASLFTMAADRAWKKVQL